MTRIELARRARADLDDIETYLQREAGEARAKRMLARSGADNLLIILRIVHGARDLPTLLSSE